MTSTTGEPLVVSRRIAAQPGDIFRILAAPGRHPDLDGSRMLEDRRAELDSGRAWWQTRMESTLERVAELCSAR